LKKSLKQGLELTLRELKTLREGVEGLPSTGIPAELQAELAETLAALRERLQEMDFFRYGTDLNTRLTEIKARVRAAAERMQTAQAERLQHAERELQTVPEWVELTAQEQQDVLGALEGLAVQVEPDLQGLKALVNQDFTIQNQVLESRQRIERLGRDRVQARVRAEQEQQGVEDPARKATLERSLRARSRITSLEDLDYADPGATEAARRTALRPYLRAETAGGGVAHGL
jgi:hypothetical protein